MKILICITFLTSFICIGQRQNEFKVLDSLSSLAISDAYILLDGKIVTNTDANGLFELDSDTEYLQLQISHVSYKPFLISKEEIDSKTVFFLNENYFELDELVVTNRKMIKTLLPSLSKNSRRHKYDGYKTTEGADYATYIPNSRGQNAIIRSIIIETSKGYRGDPNKQYMPFKVNLYGVNKETSLPNEKLLKESILTYKNPNSKEKYVKVDISEFEFEFPLDGIYVVVETLSIIEYQDYSQISQYPPAFRALKKTDKFEFKTYERVYSSNGNRIIKDWVQEPYPIPTFVSNFGVEVKYY